MREIAFSEKKVLNRWLGVIRIWSAIQGETKELVKRAEKRHRNQIMADTPQVFEAESEIATRNRLRQFEQKWSQKEPRCRIIPMRSFNNTTSVEQTIYGIIAYVLNNPTDMPNLEFTQIT